MTWPTPVEYLGELDDLAANIVSTFNDADARSVSDGRSWYQDAHGIACSLDPDAPSRAAGVLAALSPQTSWTYNVRLARRAYADRFASGHTRLFCSRANAILRDGCSPLSVLGGPKVRAFYALITDPSDSWTVCVDRHAVAVALGRTLSDRERKVLERRGAYDHVADAFRKAAAELGELPHVVQAVTWCAWRRQHSWTGRDPHPTLFD